MYYNQILLQNQLPLGSLRISDSYATDTRCCTCNKSDRWQRLDTVPEAIKSRISIDEIDQIVKEINEEYNSHILKVPSSCIALVVLFIVIGGFIAIAQPRNPGTNHGDTDTVMWIGIAMIMVGVTIIAIFLAMRDCMVKGLLSKMVRFIERIGDRYDQIAINTQTKTIIEYQRERTFMDIYISLK